jgi:hypothetical protein
MGNLLDVFEHFSVTASLFRFDLLSELAGHSGHVQKVDVSAVQQPE